MHLLRHVVEERSMRVRFIAAPNIVEDADRSLFKQARRTQRLTFNNDLWQRSNSEAVL